MFPSPSLSCCHGAPATVANMTQRLTPGTALLLTIPPLLWAGNAVVGRMAQGLIPPVTLNFLRWALAFFILLPLAGWVLRRSSGLWSHWRRFALLGLLGVGCYNALQYLALKTSTPLNVTLVASSIPLWMLATGALFFGARVTGQQLLGAGLSMAAARRRWLQRAIGLTVLTITTAVSDVEVSVSTDRLLNVGATTRRHSASRRSGSIAASVKAKVSIVAMLGSIMPTPFAIATTRADPIDRSAHL